MIQDEHAQKRKLRRTKLINLFSYIAFGGICFSIIPDLAMGLWYSALITLGVSSFFLLIVYINHKWGADYSANLLILSISVLTFIFANFVGKASNLHLFYTFLILSIPFVIDIENRWLISIHMLHPLLGILVLEGSNYHFIPTIFNISAEEQEIFGSVNLMIFFFIMPFVVYAILYSNYESEDLLKKQNEELQRINSELDRFAYSVSHDLRSPIASVLGLVNLSKLDPDPSQYLIYNGMIEENLLKLDGFIEDILNHSRNSRLEINYEKIDFESLINGLLQQHQYAYQDHHPSISLDIEQIADFYSDVFRLNIILHNLISNSFRYADPSKEKQKLDILIRSDEKKCTIEVKDNGIGIQPELIDKIFDMFFRANYESKGSGLGLYLVKECLKKIHGDIKVDSELGVFANFLVSIPNKIPSS